MKMTVAQTARVAKNLLKVIKDYHLSSIDVVRKKVGQPMDPDADDKYHGEEVVEASIQPSNRGTTAVVLSYTRRTGQRPLEIRMNEELGYFTIMLTCESKLSGYDCFDQNEEGDYFQDKKITVVGFGYLEKELKKLAEMA